MSDSHTTPMTKKQHNGIISFWKFAFCIMVIIFHISSLKIYSEEPYLIFVKNGSIAVEFFFIVSGVLMCKNALKQKTEPGITTVKYVLAKVAKLLPFMILAFCITLALTCNGFSTAKIVNSFWQLFFFDMTGLGVNFVLYQAWYISAMLLAMMVLYPLIIKFKDNFIYAACPLIVLVIGGIIAKNYGNLDGVTPWVGITYVGVLRGLLSISLGCIALKLSDYLKSIRLTKLAQSLLTVAELVGFIGVFIIANQSSNYDFWMLLMLFLSVSLAFSEQTLFVRKASNRFINFLGDLSLPMYLNQLWIYYLIKNLFQPSYGLAIILAILLNVIVSILEIWLIPLVLNRLKNLSKKLFIERA